MCRVWRNETGVGFNGRGGRLRYGLKGSSDIIGITRDGKFLAIEAKTGNAKQSTQQKNFQSMVETFGGNYFVVRTVTEAIEKVKHALGII
jgi:hypothetical protein